MVDDYSYEYKPKQTKLTSEQKKFTEAIGITLANIVIYGVGKLNENAKSWIKRKFNGIKRLISGKTKASQILEEKKKCYIICF